MLDTKAQTFLAIDSKIKTIYPKFVQMFRECERFNDIACFSQKFTFDNCFTFYLTY